MIKYFIIVVLFIGNIYGQSNEQSEEFKKHFEFVKKVINSSDSLNAMFLDTNISVWEPSNLKDHLRNIEELKIHIKDNKFEEGYIFEKDTLIKRYFMKNNKISLDNFYLWHDIKIRSNATGEIIWFSFLNSIGITKEDRWKFSNFFFCNNPDRMNPMYNEPCDKK